MNINNANNTKQHLTRLALTAANTAAPFFGFHGHGHLLTLSSRSQVSNLDYDDDAGRGFQQFFELMIKMIGLNKNCSQQN